MPRPRSDRTIELRALITPELRVQVGMEAVLSNRSLAAEVETLLREALETRRGALAARGQATERPTP